MIPGIIPVGVTTPAFSYKEGYTGTLASGGTATISMTTPPGIYRWVIISAGCGQSSSNSNNIITISVNGSPATGAYSTSSADSGGTGSASTSHAPARLVTGSSFTLGLSNPLGIAMNYTVAVFEIPTLGLQYSYAGSGTGASPYSFYGTAYRGGIVISSFFGQGGTGGWANITYSGMTKVPVASSGQEALAYSYTTVDGTLNGQSTNSATYNRIFLISGWRPV